MNIYPLGHEESLRALASDPRTIELVEVATRHRELLGLVFSILRRFQSVAEVDHGRESNGLNLAKLVGDYRVRPSLLPQRKRIGELADELFRAYAGREGQLRGAVLEVLVEARLRSRYDGDDDLLDNNLKFAIWNGARYTSGEKSIDVIGHDGSVGECHDCKVNASRFEPAWVHELQSQVAPFGFRIGLVTATTSRPWADRKLSDAGVKVTAVTTVVTAEDFHPLMPLCPRP
jgi:hypothetical protein